MSADLASVGFDPGWSVHPGETLREILEESGITQATLAREMGVTQKHMNFVIQGKARMTAQFAVRLERALGLPKAEFWMSYQARHDLYEERKR